MKFIEDGDTLYFVCNNGANICNITNIENYSIDELTDIENVYHIEINNNIMTVYTLYNIYYYNLENSTIINSIEVTPNKPLIIQNNRGSVFAYQQRVNDNGNYLTTVYVPEITYELEKVDA